MNAALQPMLATIAPQRDPVIQAPSSIRLPVGVSQSAVAATIAIDTTNTNPGARRGGYGHIGHFSYGAYICETRIRWLNRAHVKPSSGTASDRPLARLNSEALPQQPIKTSGRCRRALRPGGEFGGHSADTLILFADRLAGGAELAFAIGELDFGGLAALLRLAYVKHGAVHRFVHPV